MGLSGRLGPRFRGMVSHEQCFDLLQGIQRQPISFPDSSKNRGYTPQRPALFPPWPHRVHQRILSAQRFRISLADFPPWLLRTGLY